MNNNQAKNNYIYYRNNSWVNNRATLLSQLAVNNQDISEAYKANAQRLEANLNIGTLPDNFVEEVIKLLDFNEKQQTVLQQEQQKFFEDIQNFVGTELSKTMLIGGISVGTANVQLQRIISIVNQDQTKVNEIAKRLQEILVRIDEFDRGFQDIANSEVSFLSVEAMKKTKKAYDEIKSFTMNPTAKGPELSKTLSRLIGLLLGDLKGGLLEYADYIHNHAVAVATQSVVDAVAQIKNVQLTGVQDTIIKDEKLAAALGQSVFRNKADNLVTIEWGANAIQIAFGISDKSYTSGKARGKSLAAGVRWQALFHEAGLSESAFEYYYANMMVHERAILNNPNNILNKYLAAKASSFILSGIAGGTTPQAMFIRYANKIVYAPSLLRKIAENGKGFRLTPSGTVDNTFVNQNNGPNAQDAYARTRSTISKLRSGIAFNAYR